jgi:hypothetical protein
VASGTNAYTVSLSPTPASYLTGMEVAIPAGFMRAKVPVIGGGYGSGGSGGNQAVGGAGGSVTAPAGLLALAGNYGESSFAAEQYMGIWKWCRCSARAWIRCAVSSPHVSVFVLRPGNGYGWGGAGGLNNGATSPTAGGQGAILVEW